MRIIRGSHRGRQIFPPSSLPVRPTTDYAKEGLFNILEHTFDFSEMEVLDLFAGTGSISYEFASRGCKKVTSVEINRKCYDFINETSRQLNFNNIRSIHMDTFRFLTKNLTPYSLVFADPPYQLEALGLLPGLILNSNLLYPGGWFILEHPGMYDFSAHQYFLQHRKYGEVNFSIFEFLPA